MSSPTETAVAVRETGPRALIAQHADSFATVLPSHINAASWVRVAQGALKRGKMQGNQYVLEIAAQNNPGRFLAALLDAARLGLEPGTEEYYLTPRKEKGRLEILGIVGWQGYVELMYRAGAVSTVVAELVRQEDNYHYRRGVDRVPVHDYVKFGGEASRGPIIGVYAYAEMKDGAISRVIELGQEDIDKIKAQSQGADSDFSPWQNWEEAMWLKSAVRQLRKWVPTSSEWRAEKTTTPPPPMHIPEADEPRIDYNTGEVLEASGLDEFAPNKVSPGMVQHIQILYRERGVTDRAERLADTSAVIGRDVTTTNDLTVEEGARLAEVLEKSPVPAK